MIVSPGRKPDCSSRPGADRFRSVPQLRGGCGFLFLCRTLAGRTLPERGGVRPARFCRPFLSVRRSLPRAVLSGQPVLVSPSSTDPAMQSHSVFVNPARPAARPVGPFQSVPGAPPSVPSVLLRPGRRLATICRPAAPGGMRRGFFRCVCGRTCPSTTGRRSGAIRRSAAAYIRDCAAAGRCRPSVRRR